MIGIKASISTYRFCSRSIMELLFDHGRYSLEMHLVVAVVQLLERRSEARCWLSLTPTGTYGSCQVVALFLGIHSRLREMIKYINARTAQYSRVQQHQATGQRVATRAHKRMQYSYSACSISLVHMRSSWFLISANPNCNIVDVVALDHGKQWNITAILPPPTI